MTQASPPSRLRWRAPLVAGLCFGLGYGVTQRLLALQLPEFVRLGQGFELREFPGTSLRSLRLQYGDDQQPIRADLDQLELERQNRLAEQAAEQERQRLAQEAEAAEAGDGLEPDQAEASAPVDVGTPGASRSAAASGPGGAAPAGAASEDAAPLPPALPGDSPPPGR